MIEFQNVSFAYPDTPDGSLKNITLTIPDGQCVLLCGPSACAQSYIDWMNKSNFYFTFAMNIMPATLLSVLPIGGLLLKSGTLSPEKFMLIVLLSMGLITPIIGCMKFTDDLAKVGTIISQVTDILTAPELPRPETDTETPHGSTVQLQNVRFGYSGSEVLHGIDLTFRQGTVNALVGPSGSGKSTIAKLIASFWDVSAGSITVGGADLRCISPAHYHQLVAYVSQDNFLFDTTVRETFVWAAPAQRMPRWSRLPGTAAAMTSS